MLTLTLDTSVVNDWLHIKNVHPDKSYRPATNKLSQAEAEKLNTLANNRIIDLAITTLTLAELDMDTLPWPLNADISTTLESPQEITERFPIIQILAAYHPDPDNNQKRGRQLLAHLTAKRNYFITNDPTILEVADELAASAGIKVLTFSELQEII